jgi:hypothetical protein
MLLFFFTPELWGSSASRQLKKGNPSPIFTWKNTLLCFSIVSSALSFKAVTANSVKSCPANAAALATANKTGILSFFIESLIYSKRAFILCVIIHHIIEMVSMVRTL